MDKPLFTPGPWTLHGRAIHASGVSICNVSAMGGHVQAEYANATLIAAAPDLYGALAMWLRFARECETRKIMLPLWAGLLNEQAVELTEATLAKVDGRL